MLGGGGVSIVGEIEVPIVRNVDVPIVGSSDVPIIGVVDVPIVAGVGVGVPMLGTVESTIGGANGAPIGAMVVRAVAGSVVTPGEVSALPLAALGSTSSRPWRARCPGSRVRYRPATVALVRSLKRRSSKAPRAPVLFRGSFSYSSPRRASVAARRNACTFRSACGMRSRASERQPALTGTASAARRRRRSVRQDGALDERVINVLDVVVLLELVDHREHLGRLRFRQLHRRGTDVLVLGF
jgi:hypothetical protein